MSLLGNNPLGDKKKLSKKKDSESSNERIRNVYSLPKELNWDLDDMKVKTRRLLNHKISKGEIVEAALIIAFREFEEHGDKSDFVIELKKIIR